MISYPEYKWSFFGSTNHVYEGVRELFHLLELDEANYGTPSWNPLGKIIYPGDSVIVKPNYLWHSHKYRPDEWEQVITHGSVVRAVVDYVLMALNGRGEVWIADGPQLDANWQEIISRTGIANVCDFYRSVSPVPVRLLDLRDTWIDVRGDVAYDRAPLPGDPDGAMVIDLGYRSRFHGHTGSGHYYGADYDQAETNHHHSNGRHEYRFSRKAISADVFINLPKMKVHKKVGVTLCLKNLVGITTGRNWLPHYTLGDPSTGGDQFEESSVKSISERWGLQRFQKLILRCPKVFTPLLRMAKIIATPLWGRTEETVRSGNWYGNDTAWRMVHDLNRCLLYSDGDKFPLSNPKRYFAVIDGVIAGDGNAPAAPDRYEAGVLMAGFNPVALDSATARLMGFDPMKIPLLREAFSPSDLPLVPFTYSDISIHSDVLEWQGALTDLKQEDCYHFRPHFGWLGRIEWTPSHQVLEMAR
jgi:uncharacterized protein (DUF362 family)